MKTDKLIITKFEYAIMLATWHFDDKALLAQKINRNEHITNDIASHSLMKNLQKLQGERTKDINCRTLNSIYAKP